MGKLGGKLLKRKLCLWVTQIFTVWISGIHLPPPEIREREFIRKVKRSEDEDGIRVDSGAVNHDDSSVGWYAKCL